MPTNEELIELGKKTLALREKDKKRTKAVSTAVKQLIAAHKDEYQDLLAKAQAKV